jgi:hypothetical protein
MINFLGFKFVNKILHNLIIIISLAILTRSVFFVIFDFQNDYQGGDSKYYLETGRNIVEYGVHGSGAAASYFRPPLYSFFAGIVANISDTAVCFYLVQSALFIGFSVAVYFLLLRYSAKLAYLSALLISISPFDVLMNGRVLSENLITPLFVLGTLLFVNADNSKLRFFISGVLLGGAVLCRDIYLLFPILLLVTGLVLKLHWRYLVIFLIGFTLTVTPWVYRNSQLPAGGLFLSKGILWTGLWVGVWERSAEWTKMPNPYALPPEAFVTFDNGNSPNVVKEAFVARDENFFRRITIDYAMNDPMKVIRVWVVRYPLLWFGTRSDLNTSIFASGSLIWYIMKVTFFLVNAFVVIFAVIGIFFALRLRKLPLLMFLPVIYSAFIYIPFHNVETRYSLPIMPILTVYFSYFLIYIQDDRQLSGTH